MSRKQDKLEDHLRKLAKQYDVSTMAVAFHNVLCFGKLFEDHYGFPANFGKGDKLLGEIIDHAEALTDACFRVEKKNKNRKYKVI